MMGAEPIADFQDDVKHIVSDITGTVVAVYMIGGIRYFDVLADGRIYYNSPASLWEIVAKSNE